jgi:Carbohydrate-selective porin, OprB family
MIGAGVKDLAVPGSLLAASVGQPSLNNLPNTQSFGPNSATQTNYEAFYRFPINDNITVTPGFNIITHANNTAGQPTIIQGYMRTTFSF